MLLGRAYPGTWFHSTPLPTLTLKLESRRKDVRGGALCEHEHLKKKKKKIRCMSVESTPLVSKKQAVVWAPKFTVGGSTPLGLNKLDRAQVLAHECGVLLWAYCFTMVSGDMVRLA